MIFFRKKENYEFIISSSKVPAFLGFFFFSDLFTFFQGRIFLIFNLSNLSSSVFSGQNVKRAWEMAMASRVDEIKQRWKETREGSPFNINEEMMSRAMLMFYFSFAFFFFFGHVPRKKLDEDFTVGGSWGDNLCILNSTQYVHLSDCFSEIGLVKFVPRYLSFSILFFVFLVLYSDRSIMGPKDTHMERERERRE